MALERVGGGAILDTSVGATCEFSIRRNRRRALAKGIGYAAAHQDCAFGSGALEVARYGHVLQARALVGVRGAGLAYDGLYFVTKVTHDIRRGGYTQQFSLARNGLISTVPAVPA